MPPDIARNIGHAANPSAVILLRYIPTKLSSTHDNFFKVLETRYLTQNRNSFLGFYYGNLPNPLRPRGGHNSAPLKKKRIF